MMIRPGITISLALAASLFCPTLFAVEIDSRVLKNRDGIGNTIQLLLTAKELPDAEPDLSALNLDFSILHRSRTLNSRTVNGKTRHSVRWILQLRPRHPGVDRIPVIQFGQDSSPAVHLAAIGSAESAPVVRNTFPPPAMPVRSVPRPVVEPESPPPAAPSPRTLERAAPPDTDSLDLGKLLLVGGLGGLFAAVITGYRRRRQGEMPPPANEQPHPSATDAATYRTQRRSMSATGERPPAAGIEPHDVTTPAVHPAVTGPGTTPVPRTHSNNRKPDAPSVNINQPSPPERKTRMEGNTQSKAPLPKHGVRAGSIRPDPSLSERSIRAEGAKLHQACVSTDPELAGAALLEWARDRWPDAPPHTLGSLASQFAGTDVEREIRHLDKILYSPVKKEWHGAPLWQVMKGFMVEQEVEPKKRHRFAPFHIG